MAYDATRDQLLAYIDQNRSPAERLAMLAEQQPQPMTPLEAQAASVPPATGFDFRTGTPQGVPVPAGVPAPAAPTAIPEVTVTGGPAPAPAPRPALGGVPAGGNGAPAPWLRGYMQGGANAAPAGTDPNSATPADVAGFDARGAPEYGGTINNPVGDIVKPFTPDELGVSREIDAERFANIQDTADAQDYARQATARAQSAALDKQEEADAEVQRRAAERSETLRQGEQRYREMADAIAAEPIDSERLWNNKSTGEKTLGAIAVFMGGIGQGIAGLPNMAWEKIQRDIDRDIEAQKANKAMMQNRLAAEGSLLDMARQRFGDAATQDAAMRESAYRRVAAELDRFKEFAKTPERAAQLDALRLEADTAIAGAEQQRRQALDAAVIQQRQIDAARRAAGGPKSKLQQAKEFAQLRGYQASAVKDERFIEGGSAALTPKQQAASEKAIREANAEYDSTKAQFDRYLKSNLGIGVSTPWAKRKEAEKEVKQTQTDFQNKFLGKSDADAAAAASAIPEGGVTTSDAAIKAAYDAAMRRAADARDAKIKGAGGTVAPKYTPPSLKK